MYSTSDEITPDASCVLCNKVLPNSAVVPAKLRRNCNIIALNMREKYIRFSSLSLGINKLSEAYSEKVKGW